MIEIKWLTLEDISLELGIPLKSITYYHENGEGPTAYKFGSHIRVRKQDFDSWVTSRGMPNIKAIDPKVFKKDIKKLTSASIHPSKQES